MENTSGREREGETEQASRRVGAKASATTQMVILFDLESIQVQFKAFSFKKE